MGLSVCIDHAVGISLTKRRTMTNYSGPVGLEVL